MNIVQLNLREQNVRKKKLLPHFTPNAHWNLTLKVYYHRKIYSKGHINNTNLQAPALSNIAVQIPPYLIDKMAWQPWFILRTNLRYAALGLQLCPWLTYLSCLFDSVDFSHRNMVVEFKFELWSCGSIQTGVSWQRLRETSCETGATFKTILISI